ncbi:transcription elongation factor GreA [Candidatus Saccharibacteria bacterium]|jgi:transcription elongation factor GreA|nr:transcription elongation factor GreA [Candidatus Saccharibacteria bacterium]
MKKLFNLTQEGADELKSELDTLIKQRVVIADRIKQARELGDLSENAEYQTAREEQDRLEARIGELEHVLTNMQIIKKPKTNGHVRLGSSVILKASSKTKEFQIVGTMEADPIHGKVSDESPIGQALLGKKVGDKAQIKTPAETVSYTIVEIR